MDPKRQSRRGLGYGQRQSSDSRRPAKWSKKTALRFHNLPTDVHNLFYTVCLLFVFIGRLDVKVRGRVMPTFRAFRAFYSPGDRVYGVVCTSGGVCVELRLDTLPPGRAGLREFRRRLSSWFAHRAACKRASRRRAREKARSKAVAFVQGPNLVESTPTEAPPRDSTFPVLVRESVMELLPFDARVKGTAIEAVTLRFYREFSRDYFSSREGEGWDVVPLPEELRECLEGDEVMLGLRHPADHDLYYDRCLPEGRVPWSLGRCVDALPDVPVLMREWLLDLALPRAPVSDFELPGLLRTLDVEFVPSGSGAVVPDPAGDELAFVHEVVFDRWGLERPS